MESYLKEAFLEQKSTAKVWRKIIIIGILGKEYPKEHLGSYINKW